MLNKFFVINQNCAPWFVSNLPSHNDLKIPFVHEEVTLHAKDTNYASLAIAIS
jgi:hypothetical protein